MKVCIAVQCAQSISSFITNILRNIYFLFFYNVTSFSDQLFSNFYLLKLRPDKLQTLRKFAISQLVLKLKACDEIIF